MGGADYRMQQACEEEQAFLWSSLNNLRGHISAGLFQQAERELGFVNEIGDKNEHISKAAKGANSVARNGAEKVRSQ